MAPRPTRKEFAELSVKLYTRERELERAMRDYNGVKDELEAARMEHRGLAAAWDKFADCKRAWNEWVEIDKGETPDGLATVRIPRDAVIRLNQLLTVL